MNKTNRVQIDDQFVLPPAAHAFEKIGCGLAAELALGGKSFGRRIRDPFLWKTGKFSGTVRAELTLFSSCGRLFGEKIVFAPDASEGLTEFCPRNDEQLLF